MQSRHFNQRSCLLGRGLPAPPRLSNSPLAMLSTMRSSTRRSIWFLVCCLRTVFRSLVTSHSTVQCSTVQYSTVYSTWSPAGPRTAPSACPRGARARPPPRGTLGTSLPASLAVRGTRNQTDCLSKIQNYLIWCLVINELFCHLNTVCVGEQCDECPDVHPPLPPPGLGSSCPCRSITRTPRPFAPL